MLFELSYIGMPVVRTDGQAVNGHVITKLVNLAFGLRKRASRARSRSAYHNIRSFLSNATI